MEFDCPNFRYNHWFCLQFSLSTDVKSKAIPDQREGLFAFVLYCTELHRILALNTLVCLEFYVNV